MLFARRAAIGILTLVLLPLSADATFADVVQYEFAGVLPSGAASLHPQVNDGENWNAAFLVNMNVPDSDSSSSTGFYASSVLSGEIVFSGGYSQQLNVDGWQTTVWDDLSVNNELIDGIAIMNFQGTTPFPVFQAIADSSAFSGDNHKQPGFSFASGNVTASGNYNQLYFSDQSNPRHIVNYSSGSALNVGFNSSVPEPSSMALVMFGCVLRSRSRTR
ncbi:MAG: hypothetical protein AAF483_06810 [Planctomycetota bacterium]